MIRADVHQCVKNLQPAQASPNTKRLSLSLTWSKYLLLVLPVIFFLLRILPGDLLSISGKTSVFPQNHPHVQKIPYLDRCSNISATKTYHFSFDIPTEGKNAAQWHLVDSSPHKPHKTLRGDIIIDRGHPSQTSDIEILVLIRSNSSVDLDKVLFYPSPTGLAIDYLYTGEEDLCTELQILIFPRPDPKLHLDTFSIHSNMLEIHFKERLAWSIDNLIAHTSHADLTMDQNLWYTPLLATNITFSSVTGIIYAQILLVENLLLVNEEGGIALWVGARLGTNELFSPQSIEVKTKSGDVHMLAPPPAWPVQTYTHSVHVSTVSGNVEAQVHQGSVTNISSTTGSMEVYIKPYGVSSPNDRSEIFTNTITGDIGVFLRETDVESLEGRFNPMENLASLHHIGAGRLRLEYPKDWSGDLVGKVEEGELKFEGSGFEDGYVQQGDNFVLAGRGPGNSRMEASAETGEIDILLK